MGEEILKGAPISEGVAIGNLVFSEVFQGQEEIIPELAIPCLLYTSPSPRD